MPSTFPEAFGMVAVEAAACGALPISADHSGMREVSRQLAAELPGGARRAHLVPRRQRARSRRSPARIDGWLALPEARREAAREALVETSAAALELGGRGPRSDRRLTGRA